MPCRNAYPMWIGAGCVTIGTTSVIHRPQPDLNLASRCTARAMNKDVSFFETDVFVVCRRCVDSRRRLALEPRGFAGSLLAKFHGLPTLHLDKRNVMSFSIVIIYGDLLEAQHC